MTNEVDASQPQQEVRRSSGQTQNTIAGSGNRHSRRATRACDRCKQKKMRCTGQQPCTHCVNARAACEYNAKYTRGKAPPIQNAAGGGAEPSSRHSDDLLAPSRPQDRRELTPARSASQIPSSAEAGTSRRVGDEIPEAVETGRVGDGGLHRATRGSFDRGSSRRYSIPVYAYGDPPMPTTDLSFLILPSLSEARALIARYFEDIDILDHFLHQGSVIEWFNYLLCNFWTGQDGDACRQAIVLLVLASAINRDDSSSSEEDSALSYRYFQAADDLLRKETGPIRLESVQGRLLQCGYLLSRSRINQAWSVFGTVVSQVHASRLHRKAQSERAASENWINTECRKRTFWTAYTLDKYLALSLGLPQHFHEEDIDQTMPLMINDEHLSATNYMGTTEDGNCTMKAQFHRTRIATLFGEILRDYHGTRPPTLEERISFADKYDMKCRTMLPDVAPFMEQNTPNAPALLKRQITQLKVLGAFMLLLRHRSFILDSPAVIKGLSIELQTVHEDLVFECLKSALAMTGLATKFYEADGLLYPSWIAQFSAFSAVVCLFVYIIKHPSEPVQARTQLFKAAEKCQNLLKRNPEKGTFAQRCNSVLDELHADALRVVNGQSPQDDRDESLISAEADGLAASRSQEPQYSADFAGNLACSSIRKTPGIPAITYGSEWRDANFDQTAPGGGILDSMDWIHQQKSSSIADKIEKYGFHGLTEWS